jgi:uncharacterized protein
MKILISGASGLVGTAVVAALERSGNEVRKLIRGYGRRDGIRWNVETGEIDQRALEEWKGPDAVIHLAGENIGSGRWTPEKKRRIRDSRVTATRRLVTNLAHAAKIRTFVGASAIGFYGDRGDEVLTEASSKGHGFLADTCEGWEAAAEPLVRAGARVVHLRFGMILSGKGGALAKMLPVFRLGLGGRLGGGKQWVSWISRTDVVRAIEFALQNKELAGPANVVTANPVPNHEFARELGGALHRPAVIAAPAFFLRMAFGEIADALLLSSQCVMPEKLRRNGFQFEHPALRNALQACL